jgi:hypothetical protein
VVWREGIGKEEERAGEKGRGEDEVGEQRRENRGTGRDVNSAIDCKGEC